MLFGMIRKQIFDFNPDMKAQYSECTEADATFTAETNIYCIK